MPAIAPSEPLTFAQAMELERVSAQDETYLSKFPALSYDYAPGKPLSVQRSYGGHVYAQAMWAASLTIRDLGLRIHETNGYWTQAGYANRPFIFEIETLSQTRSFVLRQVMARQPTTPSDDCPFPRSDASKVLGPVAFVLTCSFKVREEGPGYWLNFNWEKYGDLLQRDPTSHPSSEYLRGPGRAGIIRLADFPGIEIRTPDLTRYNDKNSGTEHRRMHIYRGLPPMVLDPNMLAAAHAYVSDRAGLSVLLHTFGATELGMSGSLNHKMVFHIDPEKLRFEENGWYIQEMSSSRGAEGRAVVESRIWSPTGELVASTVQDAMFRTLKPKLS
ncbi:thioesterase-like superfamily-domain-containing protein [Aspergillus ambiguus]|uniref:acyl-CoA thioesterase n=1 Tax=Aspergillus ambiguus TaxID=176160 RepID=UPI003CCDD4FB